jgi:hypothetical protein
VGRCQVAAYAVGPTAIGLVGQSSRYQFLRVVAIAVLDHGVDIRKTPLANPGVPIDLDLGGDLSTRHYGRHIKVDVQRKWAVIGKI